MDLNRESLASDVLENWTPDLPDVHPDDVERSYDDDGAPVLRCPMVPVTPSGWSRNGVADVEDGAIEGAGGTWWRPKSTAWSVEPSRIRSLSPRGRAWLKSTLSRLAHYTDTGETDQRTGPLRTAYRVAYATTNAKRGTDARNDYREACKAWKGVCVTTGETVLSLFMPRTHALDVVNAYGIAGRPLTLRPA